MPLEIHRAVRTLDSIKFWKGLEFRTFLLYLGPVILKDYLSTEVYEHFLTLFCAVTLCTANFYLKASNAAKTLFLKYINDFGTIYRPDCISSNVHSLCHVVDDVLRFGCLPSFSAYPFESKLYQLKCLIRSGNKPVAQVAKRIGEISSLGRVSTPITESIKYPYVKKVTKLNNDDISFKKIYIKEGLVLSTERNKDRWFMTKDDNIVCMINTTILGNEILIKGKILRNKTSFFERPIDSAHLGIYLADCDYSN